MQSKDFTPKTVLFIRHGQTNGNFDGYHQGSEEPLNETGLNQAQLLATRAKHLEFETIISSDYVRAQQTAQIIATQTQKPLEISPLFGELRRPSLFNGKKYDELPEMRQIFDAIDAKSHDADWHHSDEENFYDVKKRAKRALELLQNRPEETLMVVSHGNFLRGLFGMMLLRQRYSPADYFAISSVMHLMNTGITVVKFAPSWRFEKPVWQIVSWNDQMHLGQ
ncbi:MAG: histidine phosphatase family protein [Bacteroidota bacterium]